MKKSILIILVVLLLAGFLLIPRLLHKSDRTEETDPADPAPVSEEVSEPAAAEAEPVYVSDPVYGDQITEEELEQLIEQDTSDDAPAGIVVTDEFVIELDETQGTGGF